MEREDPLERLEREKREREERGNKLKPVMFALAAVAVVLAGALFYVWSQKKSIVNELEVEKQDLTAQIIALQGDYETLSSDYDNINLQLDSSRMEVAALVERIQKTQAVDRAKIRQYEKELGTLRSIMRNYVVQIDSLNTLNHKLTAEAAAARKEATEAAEKNKELTAQVEDLSGKVAAGSVIKARGLSLTAYNKSDKITDRSSRVVRMLLNLTLSENNIAQTGPIRVFVRVKDPNGNLLLDGTGASFTFNGELLAATASREVDYNGADVEMSIYINNIPEYFKGIYSAEVFTEQTRLGLAEVLLR